ncbi:hypothetical protein E3Q22_03439 [Wallemia mellicola]|uniref:Mid2 domain-containing protein n=1 Tax=Wallemia mellicola TaxID=1708541 RepID=A0A4T0MXF3_9BASI|nr:hypothetical protein E3Q23_03254 [Wallemia mellicola]TIB76676.1 hypothetical protein E3Q22_03439 [Wallemia mellicola]TIB88645.1 hypothetical protein E3Q19_03263 [Wallemia mellicola]TIB97496.1 hypothetical protein E3Q17_03382 [Wallemia mellicola]TIC09738.1 hypothetical protein E3Q15_03388 [Wallemia mellicola]
MRFIFLSTLITASLPFARSDFGFEVRNNIECGRLEVRYSGANGSPDILVLPIDGDVAKAPMIGEPTNMSPGSGVYVNNEFRMPAGVHFTVTMGDDDGMGTGGTSEILRVQDNGNGQGCFRKNQVTTYYEIASNSSNWNSCDTLSLNVIDKSKTKATDLIDYYAISPNSRPIHIQSAHINDTVEYQLTQPEQSQVMIFSLYHGTNLAMDLGGHTNMYRIGEGSTECNKPLEASPTAAQNNSSGSTNSGGISKGAIAGAVVGAVVGGAALAALVFFLLVKYKKHSNARIEYARKLESDIEHRDPNEDIDDMGEVVPFTQDNSHQNTSNQGSSTYSPVSLTNASTHSPYTPIHPSPQSAPLNRVPKLHRDAGPAVRNGEEEMEADVPPTYEDASRNESHNREEYGSV